MSAGVVIGLEVDVREGGPELVGFLWEEIRFLDDEQFHHVSQVVSRCTFVKGCLHIIFYILLQVGLKV